MVIEETDIRHTADELEERDLNKFFDIELNATTDDNKKTATVNGNVSNGDVKMNSEVVENETGNPYSKQNNAYVADDKESTRL